MWFATRPLIPSVAFPIPHPKCHHTLAASWGVYWEFFHAHGATEAGRGPAGDAALGVAAGLVPGMLWVLVLLPPAEHGDGEAGGGTFISFSSSSRWHRHARTLPRQQRGEH